MFPVVSGGGTNVGRLGSLRSVKSPVGMGGGPEGVGGGPAGTGVKGGGEIRK